MIDSIEPNSLTNTIMIKSVNSATEFNHNRLVKASDYPEIIDISKRFRIMTMLMNIALVNDFHDTNMYHEKLFNVPIVDFSTLSSIVETFDFRDSSVVLRLSEYDQLLVYKMITSVFKLGHNKSDMSRFIMCLGKLKKSEKKLMSLNMNGSKKNRLKLLMEYDTNHAVYNSALNYFKHHVITNSTDPIINSWAECVVKRCFYAKTFGFYVMNSNIGISNSIDSTNFDHLCASKTTEPTVPTEPIESRINNYDGLKINSNHSVVIRIPKSFDSYDYTKSTGGIVFGFENKNELWDAIRVSIESACVINLKYDDLSDNCFRSMKTPDFFGGCVQDKNINKYFYLELHIKHNFSIGVLPSYSTKIIHYLTNGLTSQKEVKNAFNTKCITTHQRLELYVAYQNAICKKIRQLISDSDKLESFPFTQIECYRESCRCLNLYEKYVPSMKTKNVVCKKCRIAEFCLVCHLNHAGDCDKIDSASDEWIAANTKSCPKCNVRVDKSEGCNHMKCTICNTHFCWICNMIYSLNEITEHYRNGPYGDCFGNQRNIEQNVEQNDQQFDQQYDQQYDQQ